MILPNIILSRPFAVESEPNRFHTDFGPVCSCASYPCRSAQIRVTDVLTAPRRIIFVTFYGLHFTFLHSMTKRVQPFVALLRGINVTGRNKVPMADLRSFCGKLGWGDIQTYIQSGNLIFSAAGPEVSLESELEQLIQKRFGLTIPVIVRAGTSWPDYVKANPFPEASETAPNAVMMSLPKAKPNKGAVEQLRERAKNGERIAQVGDAFWIYFKEGVAQSKLSPGLLDRVVGSPVTARNWNTVLKIDEMLKQAGKPRL